MPTITYSFLDGQMTQDDKTFFITLGKRVAELRKEQSITQSQPIFAALSVTSQ